MRSSLADWRVAAAILLLATALLLLGCPDGRSGGVSLEEVEGPFTFAEMQGVSRVRHLWLSAQPDEAALRAAKDRGIGIVIDLRAPGERDWDEASAAAALGLRYHNVPVANTQAFSEEAFERIEALLRENPGAPTLIHCSSGNRAAGWLTTHLVREHGMPFADALAIGRRAGISNEAIVEKTAAYLGETP